MFAQRRVSADLLIIVITFVVVINTVRSAGQKETFLSLQRKRKSVK